MPLQLISPPGALPMDVAEARHHVRQDADFDDVMHAFWRLSLDLPRGNVERGLKKSGGMQRKQLR